MSSERETGVQDHEDKVKPDEAQLRPGMGSEAARKGGKEPAQRQAQRDWEESSKEAGE
jgi:hypothetical protein